MDLHSMSIHDRAVAPRNSRLVRLQLVEVYSPEAIQTGRRAVCSYKLISINLPKRQ